MGGTSLTINVTAGGASDFSSNSVTAGASGGNGATAGSAYGAGLFSGSNVIFNIAPGQTATVDGIGGAGKITDPNIGPRSINPNVNGGIIVQGGGEVILTGESYYSGATVVNVGQLTLGTDALEQGTVSMVVGQAVGDDARLQLQGGSRLILYGYADGTDAALMLAQTEHSKGELIIGDGTGSQGAFIGAHVIKGGEGDATVRFTQSFATDSTINPVFEMKSTMTGSVSVVQDGEGTTLLVPESGENDFTGSVTVNSGILATSGTVAAMAGTEGITLMGGSTFQLGQSEGINDTAYLTMQGGMMTMSLDLNETMGAWSVLDDSSFDFEGNAVTLTFQSLTISAQLSVWNWDGTKDHIYVTDGNSGITGGVEQILFYSDQGQSFLGYGAFSGSEIIIVPEPSSLALALLGLSLLVYARRSRLRVVA